MAIILRLALQLPLIQVYYGNSILADVFMFEKYFTLLINYKTTT